MKSTPHQEDLLPLPSVEDPPSLLWRPGTPLGKKHRSAEAWTLEIQRRLVDALDTHFCPALFCDYQQEVWREQFIRPVVITLTPLVTMAVVVRREKGLDDAIQRAVYRALRWIQDRIVEEFRYYPDSSIEKRCQRWLQAIHALDYRLPSYPRKKGAWPGLGLTLRYEEILRWCQEVDKKRQAQGMGKQDITPAWLELHPRPPWWLDTIKVDVAGWRGATEKESGPHLAAQDILGQMTGLSRERIRAIVQRTRRTTLSPTVREQLERPRPLR